MTRQILLDTETTGSSPRNGDRILEIGMIEAVGFVPTGRVFHAYFDPCRPVHFGAKRVHGLSNAMLKGYPLFADRVEEIVDFIGSAQLYAHNAKFDRSMLEAELVRAGQSLPNQKRWTCTIPAIKRALGGGKASLDAAVTGLKVETPDRKIHGALLDTAILLAVMAKIHGAPKVDIEGLVELSEPWPGRDRATRKQSAMPTARGPAPEVVSRHAPASKQSLADRLQAALRGPSEGGGISAPEPPPLTCDPRDMPDHERAVSHENSQAVQAGRALAREIFAAAWVATDLLTFLDDLKRKEVAVRPNVDTEKGEIRGMRFCRDGIHLLTSSIGLKGAVFLEGRLRYSPLAHEAHLCALRDDFDRAIGKPGEMKFQTLTAKDIGAVEPPKPRELETQDLFPDP